MMFQLRTVSILFFLFGFSCGMEAIAQDLETLETSSDTMNVMLDSSTASQQMQPSDSTIIEASAVDSKLKAVNDCIEKMEFKPPLWTKPLLAINNSMQVEVYHRYWFDSKGIWDSTGCLHPLENFKSIQVDSVAYKYELSGGLAMGWMLGILSNLILPPREICHHYSETESQCK